VSIWARVDRRCDVTRFSGGSVFVISRSIVITHPNQGKLELAYAGFLTGDLSTLMGLLSDDITWRASGQAPVAGVYIGKDAVGGFFGKMLEVYGGTLELNVRAVLADAHYGIVLTGERGSYQGDELAYSSVHIFTFADGRCTEFLALQDDEYDRFWATHNT
jgi:ketosteroid isomerase-like protein